MAKQNELAGLKDFYFLIVVNMGEYIICIKAIDEANAFNILKSNFKGQELTFSFTEYGGEFVQQTDTSYRKNLIPILNN